MFERPLRLIGVKEVAEIAKVSSTRAHALVNKPGFPAPYALTRGGRLWLPDEVEVWVSGWRKELAELEARRGRVRG